MSGLFTRKDLLSLKWRFLIAFICLLVAPSLFFGMQYIDIEINNSLQRAQADLRNARSQIEQIEQEEATIIAYIDRYQELLEEGVVLPEDRLQFLEVFAEIRETYDLFPIALKVPEQSNIRLLYPPGESGGIVNLNSTEVEINIALLHEQDLSRLLQSLLLESPGLFQVKECQITLNNANATNFLFLGQHQRATCNILWYTFDISPQANQDFF